MKIKDKHLRVVILIALILLIVYVSMNYQTMLEGDCSLENTTEFSAVVDDVQQKAVRDCALCSPANNNILIAAAVGDAHQDRRAVDDGGLLGAVKKAVLPDEAALVHLQMNVSCEVRIGVVQNVGAPIDLAVPPSRR